MNVAIGTRLGPYEIVAPLGAGGMGEVYRAKDTRLGRDVAIKVLPPHLSANPEVRARFEREAKTISSLNHPHICTLFDVGRAPGIAGSGEADYLVMELVEGETLAHRLAKGALPTAEVLRIGGQIADALERAHRAGVIHRDVKPGNVMLARSGAKLMDFGLARGAGQSGAPGDGASASATTQSPTAPLTGEGTIVGTVQYMSPEQLEGKEADARSDLWGLGCVLYEMATGQRAFEGTTQASLISAIMRDTPRPLAELSPLSPPALDRLVSALLEKSPDDRIQTAHDVKLQLQWAGETVSSVTSGGTRLPGPAGASRVNRAALGWGIAAAVVALAIAGGVLLRGREPGRSADRTRLTIQPPARVSGVSTSAAISPDGRTVAFVATDSSGTDRLWVRDLDVLAARMLEGTEHADQPFWSPDSRWLGYFADGKLKKIAIEGGRPEVLCDAADPRGGTWGSQGDIVFAPIATGPLFRVSSDGGAASELVRPDSSRKESALRFPEFLPDGRQFLFVALPRRDGEYDVRIGQLGSASSRSVLRASSAPVYADPGYLVTSHGTRLVAYPFDARAGKASKEARALGEAPLTLAHDGARAVSVSRNGMMAYWSVSQIRTRIEWRDRAGRVQGVLPLPAATWIDPVVSPDGRQVLVERVGSATEVDLWLADLESGQSSRFTFVPTRLRGSPVWAPDGQRVAFCLEANGPNNIFVQSAQAEPQLLLESEVQFKNPYSWSPDGKFIAFEQPDPRTGWDVWLLPLEGDRKPLPLVRTPANEGGGWFSPDGRWIVYNSDESGRYELYVQSFPAGSRRVLVPGAGASGTEGAGPCWWSRDGRELMFRAGNSMRVVAVEGGSPFRTGPARELFKLTDNDYSLCPTRDLQRFLVVVPEGEMPPPTIVIDQNWVAAMRKP